MSECKFEACSVTCLYVSIGKAFGKAHVKECFAQSENNNCTCIKMSFLYH